MKRTLSLSTAALLLSFTVAEANAGELLKCEKRIRPARSIVSVEVEGLAPGAMYTAIISSGNNSALSSMAADIAGIDEFDFDSNQANVLAGASRIPAAFIGNQVTVTVTDALGNREAQTTANCRIR